jgi:uncharacterized protein
MSVWAVLAVIAGVIGIIGSIVPALPGPPLSWVGLLFAFLAKGTNGAGEVMSTTFLLVWLGVTVVVSILDYVVPMYFTKVTGGSKAASRGAIAGLIVGMVFPPVGIILGTLLGAFLADFLVADRGVWESFKSSIGAFLGFIFGTGMKLVASGIMMYYIIVYL